LATSVHVKRKKTLRILFVDKHPPIANGIAALISAREGWHRRAGRIRTGHRYH
jgi:hypothetical protein